MPLEPNVYSLFAGKQTAKGSEQVTAAKRFIQVGGDANIARDDGQEPWSDGSKYGARTKWINSLLGNGNPAIEATPNETGWLLWALHGAETFTGGTDSVITLAGSPSSGVFDLLLWDGLQSIQVGTALANTLTAAALDTSIEAALLAAGYGANQVTCAGGPLNTTPITITFNGTGVAGAPSTSKRPWTAAHLTKANDTTSPAVTITNSTPGVCAKHSFTPQTAAGFWLTFMKRIGTSVVQRQSYIDCLLGGVTLEGSTSAKALRLTPNFLSLDPAKVLAADPTGSAFPYGTDRVPFLFNEAAGTFTIDGVVIPATSEFTWVLNEDRSAVYGDDVVPFDLVTGAPSATISVTLIFDALTLAEWNKLVYGVASPTAGTKPQRFLPANGSYAATFSQKDGRGNLTGRKLVSTIPSVAWSLPDAPSANPGGGAVNITLAGTMEPPAVSQPYTIDVFNTDVAAYS